MVKLYMLFKLYSVGISITLLFGFHELFQLGFSFENIFFLTIGCLYGGLVAVAVMLCLLRIFYALRGQ